MAQFVLLLALVVAASAQVALPGGEPRGWSTEDVSQWIGAIGWSEYRGAFAQVNGKQLLALSDKQLVEKLLVVAPEHRSALLAEVRRIEKARAAQPPTTGGWMADEGRLVAVRALLAQGGLPDSPPLRTGPNKPLERWSAAEVLGWLNEVGLPQLAPAFKRLKVDGVRLASYDSEDAIHASARGAIERGHARTLQQEVALLKAACAAQS